MPIKDAGAPISFSDINDELGETSTNTLDILSAAQQFTGILDDDVVSMDEFYGLTFQAGSGTYGTRNSHAFRFVVEGDGTKKGFADGQLVDAAENDDTGLNTAAGDAVSGQSDFVDDYINNDLTNGDTVFAAASGDTKTNLRPGGDFASGTHFMLDTTANDIFQIDSNADVSNVVSRVPSNPSHSMTARDNDEITIKITSDTIVTRDLLLYRGGTFIDNILPTSSGSIGNTGIDTNFTYTGLSAGTSYTIGVRQANTHDSSSLITADYSTTAATTAWSSVPADFNLHIEDATDGFPDSLLSGALTATLTGTGGTTQVTCQQPTGNAELFVALSTSGDPGAGATYNSTNPTISHTSGTLHMRFKLVEPNNSSPFSAEDLTITFTNTGGSSTATNNTLQINAKIVER
tara:strand:+ start:366 stop:1580 length:1215 start_codon:yes stop_codon:yes gene_type:complete